MPSEILILDTKGKKIKSVPLKGTLDDNINEYHKFFDGLPEKDKYKNSYILEVEGKFYLGRKAGILTSLETDFSGDEILPENENESSQETEKDSE